MDQTQLIIGLTGRICSGKQTIARLLYQLIKENSDTHIKLCQTFSIAYFFEQILLLLKEKQYIFNVKITNLSENQLEELIGIIQEAYRLTHSEALNDYNQIKDSMLNWKKLSIIEPIFNMQQINMLQQKNYFHLIAVETPQIQRFQFFQKKYQQFKDLISLELFCFIDDQVIFKNEINIYQLKLSFQTNGIESCIENSKILIENSGDEKDLVINILNQHERIYRSIRPPWNYYFMHIAQVVKQRTSVGAVLVRNNRILATGYNGTPLGKKNCFESGCDRCNSNMHQGKDLEKCFCFHAEESAILECGTNNSNGASLYTTLFPCYQCSKIIIAAQIFMVYYEEDYDGNAKISELHKYMKVQKISTQDYVY